MSVFRDEVLKEVVIEYEGEKYPLKVRELSWSGMNRVLSKCSSFTADKRGVFDLDLYYREALIEMVVESPWGPFTHKLLTSFSATFGQKLEALVPVPGGLVENPLAPE